MPIIANCRWKNDRSNELEKLQKEVDAQRNERKSKEREFSLEIRKIEQERIRFSDDRAAWKKELEKSDDKLREKDSEIAKIQVHIMFTLTCFVNFFYIFCFRRR